jgi:hypothetical protein
MTTVVRPSDPGPGAIAKLAVVACAVALLGYTVLRAGAVSISWDESWTFVHYVLKNVWYQQAYDAMGGNHHLLNVWCMIITTKLFGESEIAVRLPSLIAHVLYLYATARIALQARGTVVAITAFLLMNVHPYLLDFFSLARGYGLGCGWIMLCLWQVWRYFREEASVKRVAWATAFASLAAMSHVIMINFLLAFGLAFLVVWAVRMPRTGIRPWWKHILVLIAGGAIGLAFILPNALGLFRGGSLNFGCDAVWDCLVRTLGEKFLYHQPYALPVLRIMGAVLVAVGGWSLFTTLVAWRGGWMERLRPLGFGLLVLAGCMLSFVLQQQLFGVPLPQTRTGLFLVPVTAFVLAASLVCWPDRTWLPALAGTVFCIPLLLHQKNSANLTYFVEWKPSGESARMLGTIAADHRTRTEQHPTVTVCASFESWGSIPYYQHINDMHWLVTTTRRPPEPYVPSDYYIVEFDGYDQVDTAHWTLLYRSEATNTTLYRDERWREAHPRTVFHEQHDMEAEALTGRSDEAHVSGSHSIRFDKAVRSTDVISWTVPPQWDGALVELSGTGMVRQPDDGNWVALLLNVTRGGQEIAHADVSSALQTVRFGEWTQVGISLRTTTPLLPGDVVQLSAWPLTDDTPMYLDDLQLWVLR